MQGPARSVMSKHLAILISVGPKGLSHLALFARSQVLAAHFDVAVVGKIGDAKLLKPLPRESMLASQGAEEKRVLDLFPARKRLRGIDRFPAQPIATGSSTSGP